MDKVDHPVFFYEAMKRFFIICVSVALLVAALVLPSFASSGSITITLSVPVISYTFVDDPDDPFESFAAYAVGGGRTEQFWVSEDPDLLMIPDRYLVNGFDYYVEGICLSGATVRSNYVTYIEGFVLPDLAMVVGGGFWDHLEWYSLDLPNTIDTVVLSCLKNGVELGNRIVYSRSDGWYCTDFDIFNYLCTIGAVSSLTSGDYVTFRLVAKNPNGVTLGLGRNLNYQFINFYESFPLRINDSAEVLSDVACTGKGLAHFVSGYGLTAARYESEYLDDGSSFLTISGVAPLNKTRHFGVHLGRAATINMFEGGAWRRSFRYRLRFTITYLSNGSDHNLTVYSPWYSVNGLDGFGDISIPVDTMLYDPSDAEIMTNVNLLYRGVTETPVYRYIFSGLVLCIPFMVGVFVINKVH